MQEDVEHRFYRKFLLGYAPVLFIAVAIILTSLYLFSSFVAHAPRMALNEWACYGKVKSKESWETALDGLNLATKFDPWNADLAYDLGKLYEWKSVDTEVWNASAKETREVAIGHFKRAVELRPTWALAWVSYAQNRLLNRKVDQVTFDALSKSFEFGWWQSEVQQKLLWLTIGIWKDLPENLQEKVKDQISSLLQRENNLVMITRIAVRFQWYDELIKLAKNDKSINYISRVMENNSIKRTLLDGDFKEKSYFCRVTA